MKKYLLAFVEEANQRGHLASFFEGTSLYIEFVTDNEKLNLVVEEGKIELRELMIPSSVASITGKEEFIFSLLKGEMRLREAIKQEKLQVNCNFRTTLYLETLFILSKPYGSLANVN